MIVLAPWDDLIVPGGFDLVRFDGGREPGLQVLRSVDVYVVPLRANDAVMQVVAKMPTLKVLQTLTSGVDRLAEHVPPGVEVYSAAELHASTVSEYAVGMVLAGLHRHRFWAAEQTAGRWTPGPHKSLAGSTAVVVGVGRIGTRVIEALRGFGACVTGVSRVGGGESLPIDEITRHLHAADVVVLCLPLNVSTRGLIGAEFLAAMKTGSLLVNVGRGPVVDMEALCTAVSDGQIEASLDVTDPEPLPPDHPAWNTEGMTIFPHVSSMTTDLADRAKIYVAAQLKRLSMGHELVGRVDISNL